MTTTNQGYRPLQDSMYDVHPGQPGGAQLVQHVTEHLSPLQAAAEQRAMATKNPQVYVPVQDRTFDGHPGQFGGSPLVQHVTVNITTEPPKDYIIWSLLCFVYLNPFCLGLAALIYSIKARDRKVARDLEGARHYGSTARQLNIAATILVAIGFLISIIIIIALHTPLHM